MTFFVRENFNSTYFSKLPSDLIEYIRSFNFEGAAKVIQKKAKYCLKKKIQHLSALVSFSIFQFPHSIKSTQISICYKNNILKAEDVLKSFSACNCCEKHQINKPKKLIPWKDTPFHGTQDTDCYCKCRQLSRFLCRRCD